MTAIRFCRLTPVVLAGLVLLASCGGSDGDDERFAACEAGTDAGGVVVGSGDPGDPAAPEPASGYRTGKRVVLAKDYMVVSANPLATKAGCEVLRDGGSAVDAAIAVQMVLGLVEPQSSGIGGGAFMLHYDAEDGSMVAYDGRETAPAAATPDYLRYVGAGDTTAPVPSARASGRSIGTPGVLRMLELAHEQYGRKPWAELFRPGIDIATDGFRISGRMAAAIEGAAENLRRDAEAADYFLQEDGTAKPLGTLLRNPDYAETLAAVAEGGADAFYTGDIAAGIVAKIGATESAADGSPMTPGLTTLADLAAYEPKLREPVCTTYRVWWVCGMPPPSSGGITVASTLGILENFYLGLHGPTDLDIEGGKPSVMGVHLVSEAERLAYADRDRYIADTDFVPLPGGSPAAMLDKAYLRDRANLISFRTSMGTAAPGEFVGGRMMAADRTPEGGTTHVSIVDRDGNAVVLTTTVESSMGSFHMTQGFLLNNQLTDFSAAPTDPDSGLAIANSVAAGKRPRSSMAPTLVFRTEADGTRGEFFMGTGSPGGSTIIQYVVKTLVAALDWGLDAQQATSMVDFGAANTPNTNVGGEHPNIEGPDDPLIEGLEALGHTVNSAAQSSGIGTIIRTTVDGEEALSGGADPRREGLVLGDGHEF